MRNKCVILVVISINDDMKNMGWGAEIKGKVKKSWAKIKWIGLLISIIHGIVCLLCVFSRVFHSLASWSALCYLLDRFKWISLFHYFHFLARPSTPSKWTKVNGNNKRKAPLTRRKKRQIMTANRRPKKIDRNDECALMRNVLFGISTYIVSWNLYIFTFSCFMCALLLCTTSFVLNVFIINFSILVSSAFVSLFHLLKLFEAFCYSWYCACAQQSTMSSPSSVINLNSRRRKNNVMAFTHDAQIIYEYSSVRSFRFNLHCRVSVDVDANRHMNVFSVLPTWTVSKWISNYNRYQK